MSQLQRIEKVAIVGATGRIGGHFAEELSKTGKHIVTAITRIGSKGELPTGVTAIQVDYDNEDSLVSALRGQHFLVITLSVMTPPDVQGKIVNAAVKAGIVHIMPSVYGYDVHNKGFRKDIPGGVDMYESCLAIERLGANYYNLSCGQWYEWSLALGDFTFGFDIKQRKVTFFDNGDERIPSSTWKQCGRALAALLSLPVNGASPCLEDFKNKPVYIESFKVNQRDMLDSLERVTGTSDNDWTIVHQNSQERFQEGLAELKKGIFSGRPKAMYSRLFFPSGSTEKPATANKLLGLPVEDLDDSTREVIRMVESGWNPFAH